MVDRSVGLDRVDQAVLRGQGIDRALGCRDHADAEGVDVAKGAPDRGHRLPHPHLRRIAERHGIETMAGGTDLDQPDVVIDVPADDAGRNPVPVLELDVELVGGGDLSAPFACVRDHVGVRKDVALRRDDEARPLGFLSRLAAVAGDRVDRDDPRCPQSVDLAWVEAVAHEGLCAWRGRGFRGRDRLCDPGRLHDHGLLRAGREPTGRFSDHQDGNAADNGGNDGDGRKGGWALAHSSHCSGARSSHRREKSAGSGPSRQCYRDGSRVFHVKRSRRQAPAVFT